MTDDPEAVLRARVQRLSARGVSAPLVQVLVGQPGTLKRFRRQFAKELTLGAAEADAAVSESLFDLALSGKSPPVTLAWAKQRLGWSVSDDDDPASASLAATRSRQAADARAALCALLEQLAAEKSGGTHGATPVVAAGAPESVTAS